MPTPVIMDVDTGVDDLVALLLAAASSEVELVGVTCVTGNVHVDKAVRNSLIALELTGLGEVEVAAGADKPLVQPWSAFEVVHGREGIGYFQPFAPSTPASSRDAVTLLVDEARGRPGELVLVATGPLTNVALAVEREPSLPEFLRGFVLMGGAFHHGGNVTPRAEANIWMDADAAARVFGAWSGHAPGKLPRCVGLEVTHQMVMTRAHLDEVCAPAPRSPLAELLSRSVNAYIDFYDSTARDIGGACMHDPLALIAAIDPSVCTWEQTRVEIELDGRWTRGETIADLEGVRRTPWSNWSPEDNAVVATAVDAPRAVSTLVSRLRRLVEAKA